MSFSYLIIRSARKTISLEIRPDGSLLVRAPRRMSDRAIREFVLSKESWLREKLKKYEARTPLPLLTEAQLGDLKTRARADLAARASRLAPLVGVSYGRITIRAQKTRWGSCSREGNLNFNCLLLLAPKPVLDYVIVHELCHRKEMNHSPAFWAEVAAILPDYAESRRWLKEHGGTLLARRPG